jgi:hypothetical protein
VVALHRYRHSRIVHMVAKMINGGVLESLNMEWSPQWNRSPEAPCWKYMLQVLLVKKAFGLFTRPHPSSCLAILCQFILYTLQSNNRFST